MTRIAKNWNNGTVPVSKEKVEEHLQKFKEHVFSKLEKKGWETFNSTYEALGKLDEEKQELSVESHERHLDNFTIEALDCAMVSFWAYVSAKEWKRK